MIVSRTKAFISNSSVMNWLVVVTKAWVAVKVQIFAVRLIASQPFNMFLNATTTSLCCFFTSFVICIADSMD